MEKTKELLHFYREFTETCSDELSTQAGRLTMPDGSRVIGVAGCYCGLLEGGEKALEPLRRFGSPAADLFGVIPYVQMQTMFDSWFPRGRQSYWKANFLRSLSDDAIDVFSDHAATTPSPDTTGPWLERMHGAATRTGVTDTAFAHRTYPYNLLILSSWSNPAEAEHNIGWTRECWDAMKPFMAAGAYVNYLEDEGDPRSREAYGPNYNRLARLKGKFDPTNFFRMNHNIAPVV